MKIIRSNSNKLGKYDAHFLEKLSVLLGNGFHMKQALIFLLEQYDVIQSAVKTEALRLVEEGGSISQLLRYLGYRNSIIIQVEFAEIHGEMEKNLLESSTYIKQKRNTLKKLIKAIQYPLILISIFIIMLSILNYTVIPQFKILYSAMGTELQGMVRIMTMILEYLPLTVLALILLGAFFMIVILMILKIPDVDKQCTIILKVPFVRFYFIHYQTMHFSREFGYLINNGMEVKDILNIFKAQELNFYLRHSAVLIEKELVQGVSLSKAVESVTLLDNRISSFINHGEYNSNVGKELLLFSEYTLEKLIMKTENITKRIQPVIFLILSLLIVCLYLVIIMPVFQMMGQIQ